MLKYKKLRETAIAPIIATRGSCGADIAIPFDESIPEDGLIFEPGQAHIIPIGLSFDMPPEHALVAHIRSSTAKKGLILGANVIDSDYTGEVHCHLINVSREIVTVHRGDRVMQLLIVSNSAWYLWDNVEKIDKERGEGGFGSTNK